MVSSRAQGRKTEIRNILLFFLNQCKTLVEFMGGMEETGVLRKRCQILEQDHDGTSVESFEMSSNEKPSMQKSVKAKTRIRFSLVS